MKTKIVKKFKSQKCIGYNEDFTKAYIESEVEFTDGTLGIRWSTTTTRPDGSIWIGELSDRKPYVVIPA